MYMEPRILSDSDRRLVGGRPEATVFFQSIIGEIHLKVSSLGNWPQLRLHNNATSLAAFCLKGSSGFGPVSALSLLAWCSSADLTFFCVRDRILNRCDANYL